LKDDHKPKKQGKKVCVNVGVDFNNKRVGHLLSRMVRNRFKQRETPMGTLIIEDHDSSCEDTNGKMKKNITLNMILFTIYLPFFMVLKDFPGIHADLRRNVSPEKPLDKDRHHSIPNLESESCHDCQAWAQRYYADVPYLQMCLNQMLRQNKELKRVNQQLKNEMEHNMLRANKKPKNSPDTIIRKSNNVNVIVGSEFHPSSISNV
jgi:hypothetical protein